MNKSHIKTFSATGFQIVFNQLFGLSFFILLATNLDKEIFGDLNWSLAISTTVCVMLTFGFDHIVVKKLSSGYHISKTAGLYFSHAVLMSALSFLLIALHHYIFGSFHEIHKLLFAIFLGSLFTFISTPFKQLANGIEKYWYLAVMNVSGNIIKVFMFLCLLLLHAISLRTVEMLFIISGIVEFIICYSLAYKMLRKPLGFYVNIKNYGAFIKESLPQMGVILLDSSYGRIDWILMGVLSTNIFTADYSFAYKAFESLRIPLLIIAPVLLPRFSKLYNGAKGFNTESVKELNALWKIESVIAVMIPLFLNICWVDAINLFTHNRYGVETKWVYAVLSLTLPMLYISNYFWTIAFAQGRLKLTFKISLIVTISNFVFNIILIGLYNSLGAAIAFLLSTFIQLVLYVYTVRETRLETSMVDFIKTIAIATVIIVAFSFVPLPWYIKGPGGLIAYALSIHFTGIYKLTGLLKRKNNG
jgi:O-antigen/teichoic acid export membrane protein